MNVFEGEEKAKYDRLRTLIALSRSQTFLDDGAYGVELLNHGGDTGSAQYLADKGYVTTFVKILCGIDTDFYKLNEKGMSLLEETLKLVGLD